MSTNPNNDPSSHQPQPADLEPEPEGNAESISPKTTDSEEYTDPDPHRLIKEIQCPLCSRPLKTPIRLPCGRTICRSCLPPLKRREGISYPQGEGREEGFICPWEHGGDQDEDEDEEDDGFSQEHSLADCGIDVVLSKIMDVFEKVLLDHANTTTTTDIQIQWKLGPYPPIARRHHGEDHADSATKPDSLKEVPTTSTIKLGRYLGTYKLSQEGNLPINAKDVVYVDAGDESSKDCNAKLDELVLKQLRQGIREELDCQVCYGLLYHPWISLCGHTFCRDCADRVLDHSNLCPFCRKRMYIFSARRHSWIHHILDSLLWGLFTAETVARSEAIRADYRSKADKEMPLFVCAPAYPTMLTRLNIFEPQYRLMIRRVLDYGNNKFGMTIPNPDAAESADQDDDNNNSGGDMEHAPFMQYGTVVTILTSEFLPDGRIMVTAMGLSRFKALRWGVTDGYYTAEIERVDDISLEEEENIEAREVAAAAAATAADDSNATSQHEESNREPSLDSLSTQQLMQICMEFIERRCSDVSAATLRRIVTVHGMPPRDPAILPYWVADVFPIPEEEAYKLLPLTSVRERLKLVATWLKRLDESGWSISQSTCVVL